MCEVVRGTGWEAEGVLCFLLIPTDSVEKSIDYAIAAESLEENPLRQWIMEF